MRKDILGEDFYEKQLGKVIGIMLSLFMLMQMTTAVFAATSELTWALAPTADKLVNLYGDRDVYTYGMGLCFQAADSGQYGVMEKNGTVIIPAEYDKVVSFYGDTYVQVVKDGKHGIINSKNEPVIAFGQYELIEKVDENTLIVSKDNKRALASVEGKLLTDFACDYMGVTGETYICARKGEKYGVLDKNGKTIVPFEYDAELRAWFGGKIFETKRKDADRRVNECCFVDTKGKVLYDGFSIANASRIKEAVSLSFWNWGENPDIYMDIEGN